MKKKKRPALILLITITSLSELWGIFGLYCADYYHALPFGRRSADERGKSIDGWKRGLA
jgi:hypothetical protein